MTDQTLKELWKIKDDIAKEHGYDLDSLVRYLRSKHTAGKRDQAQLRIHEMPNERPKSERAPSGSS
jgi:hypothetical protein